MAKISEYDNYESGKTATEVGKFEETGVIPVSGKYTADGDMETKNVPMSELLGGGSGLPEIGGDDDGKVLTVDTDHAVWATPSGGGGGLTPITVDGVYTSNLYTVTIPANNTFVTVPNITQEVNNLVVKIVPPAISSGEFLNVVVELVPESGWDKCVTVDGGLHKLGRGNYFPTVIAGSLYAQVILRGNCYEILIEDDGE